MCVCACVSCLATVKDTMAAGQIVAVLDGGRHGNESAMLGSFVRLSNGETMNKSCNRFCVVYTENSMAERKERVKGFCNQAENLFVFAPPNALEVPKRERLHYQGTTHGTVIGPVTVPAFESDDCWRLTVEDKRRLYGRSGKSLVGGACPDAVPKPKFADMKEPACWHFSPKELYEELIHSFNVKLVVAPTNIDHLLPMACLETSTPLIAYCHTQDHASMLKTQILRGLWRMWTDEKSKVYQPTL